MASIEEDSKPLFTVIALCFNHARFLHECLSSIAAQTYQDFQLIVTDDASHDESQTLIAAWLKRYRPTALFIRHSTNRGLCATLNEAVAASNGRYIAMVATDDRWQPNRLEAHAEWIATARTPVAVLFSDARIMSEAGDITENSFIAKHRPGYQPHSGALFRDLADANFIPAMCATIHAQSIKNLGGYDEALTFEDHDMWLRLAAHGGHFEYLPGTLADYRILPTSIVRTVFARPNAQHQFTVFSIARKCLETGLLTSSQQSRTLAKLEHTAYQLFLSEDSRAAECLRYVGLRNRRPRFFLLGLIGSLGLRRSDLKRWAATFGIGRWI